METFSTSDSCKKKYHAYRLDGFEYRTSTKLAPRFVDCLRMLAMSRSQRGNGCRVCGKRWFKYKSALSLPDPLRSRSRETRIVPCDDC